MNSQLPAPQVELQPLTTDDFDRLIQWIADEESLMLWSGPFFRFPLDQTQLAAYLASAQDKPPVRKIYKSVLKLDTRVIGHIELNNIDYRNRAATVSKVLVGDPAVRGQGFGEQMLRELVKIAFEELQLHRLQLFVFDFNQPAIRCYQKVGFVLEGHLRDYRKVQNGYWSSILMSLLSTDWNP
jgi:RimJ/RimL family protein N-acetyltransferase